MGGGARARGASSSRCSSGVMSGAAEEGEVIGEKKPCCSKVLSRAPPRIGLRKPAGGGAIPLRRGLESPATSQCAPGDWSTPSGAWARGSSATASPPSPAARATSGIASASSAAASSVASGAGGSSTAGSSTASSGSSAAGSGGGAAGSGAAGSGAAGSSSTGAAGSGAAGSGAASSAGTRFHLSSARTTARASA